MQQVQEIQSKKENLTLSEFLDKLKFPLKIVESIVLIFMIIIFLFPFIWMISTSLKTTQEAIQIPPSIIPSKIVIENYLKAWSSGPFLRYLGTSLFITLSVLVIQFIVMVPAAYAFSKIKFKGSNILFGIVLIGLMVPAQITFLPIYMMMSKAELINTYVPLILPFMTSSLEYFYLDKTLCKYQMK